MEKSFLFFDGIGTLGDWVGILATIITIWVTIRHFSKENRIKYEFILDVGKSYKYDPIKGEQIADGFLYTISVFNDSPTPILIRADKFKQKATLLDKMFRKNNNSFYMDLFDERTSSDFVRIEPFNKEKVKVLSHKWIKSTTNSNEIDLEKRGIEILFREIRGKEKGFTLNRRNIVK